ncbi:VOC family protein [Streptomyces olivochromogenes]|uniref:VOC family protein n=1 Tax=Streptomyces olivochromogenes TaxID=1963 RepID=UPI0036D86D28
MWAAIRGCRDLAEGRSRAGQRRPSRRPASAEPAEPFFRLTGVRYLTMYVDDLDGIIERGVACGGRVQHGPVDVGPGVRVAVLQDPDGNAIEVVDGAS